jgi:uncharacterized protein YecT (DUF1311 family)
LKFLTARPLVINLGNSGMSRRGAEDRFVPIGLAMWFGGLTVQKWFGVALALSAIFGAASLSSCDKIQEVTCTSQGSTDVTTQLIKEQIEKAAIAKGKSSDGTTNVPEAAIRAAINLLKIAFEDIRTSKVDPNSTKRFCTANVRVVFPLNAIADADKARSDLSLNTVNDLAEAAGIQRSADSFTFSLDYDVQPTDDKKSIFSESDGVAGPSGFFSEVLVSYLAKSRVEAAAQAQQQAQQQQAQEQEQLNQQARQATLDEATAENKLSTQAISATWTAIDPDTRSQIIDIQRAWIKEKTATCNIQAASTSIDPIEKETARLKCDTASNQQRIEWLKRYLPGGA